MDGRSLRAEVGILTVDEVAKLLEVTTVTLATWRAEKKGPAFVKLGRSIYYRRNDVQSWIEASVVPTAGGTNV